MKVNFGRGRRAVDGWTTVAPAGAPAADVTLDPVDVVRRYAADIEAVHLGDVDRRVPDETLALLNLLNERLPQGTAVTAVTAYDSATLSDLYRRAGFEVVESFDPAGARDLPSEDDARSTFGVRATATGRPGDGALPTDWNAESTGATDPATLALGGQELMLHRLSELRQALIKETDRRRGFEASFLDAERQLSEARSDLAAALSGEIVVDDDAEPAGSTSPAVLPGNAPIVPPPIPVDPTAPPTTGRAKVRRAVANRLPEGSKGRRRAKVALDAYRETVEYGRRLKGTWRQRSLEAAVKSPRPEPMSYSTWLAGHRISPDQVQAQKDWAHGMAKSSHLLSVQVVVLPGTGPLDRTLSSLRAQSWPAWSAVVSSAAGGLPVESGGDSRVSAIGGGLADVNAAVAAGRSDFVVVVRSGDVLEEDCLFTVASAVRRDPLLQLVVWDDDVRDADGHRHAPRFHPSWSPEMLLGSDYIGTAAAIRRDTWLRTGGLDDRFGDSALWHLQLAADLIDEQVFRSSRVLSSVARRSGPDTATAAAAVQDILDRRGLDATAELVDHVVRIRWNLVNPPRVTVVIPTRHNRQMLSTCLPSLARTDYPDFHVVIVDNGGESAANNRWYEEHKGTLDLTVTWWTETPFNYSAVNNAGVRLGDGEVLVFLNDDTELLDPTWMQELVGWAQQPEIGVAGLQLIGPDDEIQHTGVILGLGGFADHIFEGTTPHRDSIFGRNDWYRNSLAVTGACMAMTRDFYDEIGGLDERFILCGSDVAVGLDAVLRGYRNVCSPFGTVRHLESATRGTNVPAWDFFMSFWRYNSWLFGGDPYFSPNVSLSSRIPTFRSAAEPTPQQRVSGPLGRSFEVFRQGSNADESRMLADICRALPVVEDAVNDLHRANAEPFQVQTVNWFIPDIDSPFYGGINTALRIADHLARVNGVQNRFVVWGAPNENFVRSALAAAFPALKDSEIVFYSEPTAASLEQVPYADVSIATLWVTAYAVAHAPHTKRKFYLIQDFEPMFYPAGTLYSLTEESYKLGLYGLCNTDNLRQIYADDYQGKGMSFTPAVTQDVFHARGREERSADEPVSLFVYARPGHWRNCWEMAALALEELKRRLGDRVRIVTAGAWADGGGAEMDIKKLGLLDYRATGELYRHVDVGLALTVSKHPSYLPLELMACGVPVVAFDNPWGYWILEDGENSLLAKRTVDSLVDRLEKLCVDTALRRRLQTNALDSIARNHSSWPDALSEIYGYLCDPEGRSA